MQDGAGFSRLIDLHEATAVDRAKHLAEDLSPAPQWPVHGSVRKPGLNALKRRHQVREKGYSFSVFFSFGGMDIPVIIIASSPSSSVTSTIRIFFLLWLPSFSFISSPESFLSFFFSSLKFCVIISSRV